MFLYFIKQKRLKKAIKCGMCVGNNLQIYGSVSFRSESYLISIGNNVRITDEVRFITHDGGAHVLRDKYPDMDVFGCISIGSNVHIRNNVIIMPNVKIGDDCVIACGQVITKDVPSRSIVGGVPAKLIETLDEYEKKALIYCDRTKFLSPKRKTPIFKKEV